MAQGKNWNKNMVNCNSSLYTIRISNKQVKLVL